MRSGDASRAKLSMSNEISPRATIAAPNRAETGIRLGVLGLFEFVGGGKVVFAGAFSPPCVTAGAMACLARLAVGLRALERRHLVNVCDRMTNMPQISLLKIPTSV